VHRLRDHATWRPDWAVGRPRLLWYLTLEDQPALAEWVTLAHERLRGVPVLDLVPPAWLHLTLDDVGFPDELTDGQVTDVVRCARRSLAGWSAAPLVLGPVTTMEDSLVRRVQPAALLRNLRDRLRTARVEAVGALPDDQPDFDPHVTVPT
jgi:2'-5' RNA ligase